MEVKIATENHHISSFDGKVESSECNPEKAHENFLKNIRDFAKPQDIIQKQR